MMSKPAVRAAWGALVLACLLVMVRQIFVGLEIDEVYALSLGFRLVQGDRLFATMWEPHQLCALPPAVLLALYIAVTGTTTGVLVFFRVVMLVCKAAMSWVFYREFRRELGRPGAGLAALALLLYAPKWFLGPDYTGQQFYFSVAAFLCFHHYLTREFRRPWLVVLGAVCACFSFLAYPQSAAAFPFLWIGMVVLGRRGGERRWLGLPRGAWLLLGSCAVCGGVFLVWALQGMGFDLAAFLARGRAALLAGVSAGAGGLPVYCAVYRTGTACHLFVSDLAGPLRPFAAGPKRTPRGAAHRPRMLGGAGAVFGGLPAVVRADHRLESPLGGRHPAGAHPKWPRQGHLGR